MAKIVEVESDVSVGTPDVAAETGNKGEDQVAQTLNQMMKRSYILGLSTGMKTMCGSILEKMNENRRLNPQKQLILLREWCHKNLAQQDKFDANKQSQQTTNSQNSENNKENAQ